MSDLDLIQAMPEINDIVLKLIQPYLSDIDRLKEQVETLGLAYNNQRDMIVELKGAYKTSREANSALKEMVSAMWKGQKSYIDKVDQLTESNKANTTHVSALDVALRGKQNKEDAYEMNRAQTDLMKIFRKDLSSLNQFTEDISRQQSVKLATMEVLLGDKQDKEDPHKQKNKQAYENWVENTIRTLSNDRSQMLGEIKSLREEVQALKVPEVTYTKASLAK